ncbi:iron-siderophore ABC transporter substrate-binding protein [Marinomonas sp. PE14-40]|uniref:iron-siderophore ABC transporter substrate-binding protein n=1 Tax=Marinomonas sp. PE14-40 TaxID=3060621 RepID=UPI003F667D64
MLMINLVSGWLKVGLSCLALVFSFAGLAEVRIQDSQGEKVFAQTPVRIAALSWELVEDVIELGLEPVAIPEREAYQEWVAQPVLPASSVDIGGRAEPNLEKIAQLKPDVILIGAALKDIQAKLERIAPVVFFDTYQRDHNNQEKADQVFLTLAKLLDKEGHAQAKLATRHEVFEQLKSQLNAAFPAGLPKVTSLRFASTTSAYVYGDNAMPQYALERLGLQTAMPLASTQWGVTQKRLKSLRGIKEGVVLYFKPFHFEKKLAKSPLWRSMPFVKQGNVASVASTWTYGGAMSLQYLAQAMTDSLLEVSKQQ